MYSIYQTEIEMLIVILLKIIQPNFRHSNEVTLDYIGLWTKRIWRSLSENMADVRTRCC